jgi:ketosteroid isomerase-like protein
MKSHVAFSVSLVVIGGLALVYFGCANPQSNSNTNKVAVASTQPTPDKAAIEAELTRIENDWPRIMKERDAATVRKNYADDVFLVYPDGTPGSKEQDARDIESGALSADSWELSELQVKILDQDAALVTVRTTVKGGKYKMPDGRSQDISGQFRSVDTFARRNGQWQLVGSATVKILAPAAATPTPKASPAPNAAPSIKTLPKPSASPT